MPPLSDALAWTVATQALLAFLLGMNVVRLRWKLHIGLGDGGQPAMTRAVRVHANFAEWVPLTLLVLLVAELRGVSEPWIGALGLALLLARLGHAYGLSRRSGASKGRFLGSALTYTVMLLAALLALPG